LKNKASIQHTKQNVASTEEYVSFCCCLQNYSSNSVMLIRSCQYWFYTTVQQRTT